MSVNANTSSSASSSSSTISMEEMEELKKLRELQEAMRKEWTPTVEDQEEIDARSVYVGNVDYGVTSNGLKEHFKGCGTISRVSIPTDQFKRAKGFAYIEFGNKEAMQKALLRTGSILAGRRINVKAKRTNKPGFHAAGAKKEPIVKYVYVNGSAPRGRVAGAFRSRPAYKPY